MLMANYVSYIKNDCSYYNISKCTITLTLILNVIINKSYQILIFRPLLKEIQGSSESRIILDCSTENIINILTQAKEVNMLGEYQSYVLTSLDAHTLDFGDLNKGSTNITTLRLIDSQRHMVQAAVQDMVYLERMKGNYLRLTSDTLKTAAALVYDAVYVYADALRNSGPDIHIEHLDCAKENKWSFGSQIINTMKEVEIDGMTGKVMFGKENGNREFFTVEITELTKNGFRKIGSWNTTKGISYTRSQTQMESEMYQSISSKEFIVVSRIGEPYLRIKDENAEGNDRYEGYSLDLIDEIAKDLNFKYKFKIVREYGKFDKEKKQWTGIIRELRDKRGDLGICDLTITYERRSVVDFTMPFMTLGISILYSKPKKEPPDLFSFLLPFSVDVWIYMATAFLGVSLFLYIIARCSPDDWENPHPCDPNPTELENTWSLTNCLWFSIGSLMQQGCDLLPKAIATRVVAGLWWFFILIMVSSYTANLAAFLTMDRMEATIQNVEDLASQTKVKYGVLRDGSSANFFKNSNVSLYQKMWSTMESARPSVFVDENIEGVERVLRSKRQYAFFMESTSIEYQVEKHCSSLTQVGGLLDSKGYGIAMPFNSPYRIAISGSVLKMQESGKLQELKDRWWKNKSNMCSEDENKDKDSNELGIANVGGVFLVLILGCAASFVVSIFEFLWNVRKVAKDEKISPSEAFMLELKFAIRCYGTTKPVRKAKSQLEITRPEKTPENEEDKDVRDLGFFVKEESIQNGYIHMNGINENTRAKSYT